MSLSTSRVFTLKTIPNLITLLNLFLGCIAVVWALHGHLTGAAMLIVLCSVLDFLDGAAARMLKAGSETGKQLDSLADMVSFGFASSAIAYTYIFDSLSTQNYDNGITSLIPYLAFLIAIFSAVRLAIFNTDTRQSNDFIGLPTPANALFFASIPLVLAFANEQGIIYSVLAFITSKTLFITSLVMVFSYLLVSPVSMFSLKIKNIRWKDNKVRYLFLGCSLCIMIIFGLESPPAIMILYIFISLVSHVSLKLKETQTKDKSIPDISKRIIRED